MALDRPQLHRTRRGLAKRLAHPKVVKENVQITLPKGVVTTNDRCCKELDDSAMKID
jgi:hypothetical protein